MCAKKRRDSVSCKLHSVACKMTNAQDFLLMTVILDLQACAKVYKTPSRWIYTTLLDILKIFLFEDDENDQNGQNDLVMKMSSVKTIVEECIISFF